jgi:hypothetical protein
MALATTIETNEGAVTETGIVIALMPGTDSSARTELWRAPDLRSRLLLEDGTGVLLQENSADGFLLESSGGADTANAVRVFADIVPQGGTNVIDRLAMDGSTWWYQARQTGGQYGDGPYTAWINLGPAARLSSNLAETFARPNPLAAFGAVVDQLPPAAKYEVRFASQYSDPDTLDGMQSYIDFPATTNFMRVGRTPAALVSSTSASPISVRVTGHGYMTGDVVTIRGHLTNTAANGTWSVTVVDANNFTLNGSTGNGVGAATGHVVGLSMTVDAAGNLTSYGALQTRALKVFDQNNAPIMDVETGKRILAIPIQPSVDSGTALTLDLSTGLTQQVRLTGTATITLSNPTDGGRFRLWFQQDTTGSRPFPTVVGANGEIVMYTNETPPTLTTTPGAMDLFEFEYRAGPTTRFTCMTLQTNVLLPTPQVQGAPTATPFGSGTNHNVGMPATVNAGDLLLILFVRSGTSTVTTPAGWTRIDGGAGSDMSRIYKKVADGTEGGTTVNVTTSVAETGAAQALRCTRWYGTAAGVEIAGSTLNGPSTNPDPISLSPSWGVDRTLWIAAEFSTGNPGVTVYPTNFSTGQTITSDIGALCQLASCRRTLYATVQDPSAFTIGTSQTWDVYTLAVRPPA